MNSILLHSHAYTWIIKKIFKKTYVDASTCSVANLKVCSWSTSEDGWFLGKNLEDPVFPSTRQLWGKIEESLCISICFLHFWKHCAMFLNVKSTYPLLVMMGYVHDCGSSARVLDATHSSRYSIKDWWPCCTTEARRLINEPRGKVLDNAGPLKSSVWENLRNRHVYYKDFPEFNFLLQSFDILTIQKTHMKSQLSLTL